MPSRLASVLDRVELPKGIPILERSIDRLARAHDASHYMLVPSAVVQPSTAAEVAEIFRACRARGVPVTLRSGGTSMSRQGVSDSVLIDTRQRFQRIAVAPGGTSTRQANQVGPSGLECTR